MEFNFVRGHTKNDPQLDAIKESDDLSKGLSEEEMRKIINCLGRSSACFMLGSMTIAESIKYSKSGRASRMAILNFNHHMRRALDLIDPIVGEQAPDSWKKIVPYTKI